MLTCKQLTELVTDYMERRMSTGDVWRFRWHLVKCRGCRAYLNQVRMTRALVGQVAPPPPSPEVEAALRKAFASWAARPPRDDADS